MTALRTRFPEPIAQSIVAQYTNNILVGSTRSILAGGERNWTLLPFQKTGDGVRNFEKADAISKIARTLGASNILAPTPTKFNGKVCASAELTVRIRLPCGVTLLRNPKVFAEGCELRVGDAICWSLGGCMVIVFVYRSRVFAVHAGMLSLMDKKLIMTGNLDPDRSHFSVVHAVLAQLGCDVVCEEVHARILFPIGKEALVNHLQHAEHGAFNRAMLRYAKMHWVPYDGGCVDLRGNNMHVDIARIARAQLIQAGVPTKNIWIDDVPVDERAGAHHTRHEDPARRLMRNLAMVKRIN